MTHRVGRGRDGRRRPGRLVASVDPDVREVSAQPSLHIGPDHGVQLLAAALADDIENCRGVPRSATAVFPRAGDRDLRGPRMVLAWGQNRTGKRNASRNPRRGETYRSQARHYYGRRARHCRRGGSSGPQRIPRGDGALLADRTVAHRVSSPILVRWPRNYPAWLVHVTEASPKPEGLPNRWRRRRHRGRTGTSARGNAYSGPKRQL